MALDLTGVDLAAETVRTERLLLRPPVDADVDAITRACQDPDNQRWLSTLPSPYADGNGRGRVMTEHQHEETDSQPDEVVEETSQPAPEDGVMSGPDADRLRAEAGVEDDADTST